MKFEATKCVRAGYQSVFTKVNVMVCKSSKSIPRELVR